MPFFLLARDEDDQLRLLTPAISASRQDALATLARLTADPSFDAWDAEVLLVDIDSGLPVLLVRPSENLSEIDPRVTAVALQEPEVVEEEPSADVTFMWPAPEHVSPHPVSEVVPPPASEIPAEEAEAFASYVSLADEDRSGAPADAAVLEGEDAGPAEAELPVPEYARELEFDPSLGRVDAGADLPDEAPQGESDANATLLEVGVVAAALGAGVLVSDPTAEAESESESELVSAPEAEAEADLEPEGESEPDAEPVPESGATSQEADDEPWSPDADSMVPAGDEVVTPVDEANELREALERTTAAMALETVVAVESDTEEAPSGIREPPLDRWPWESDSVSAAVAAPLGATAMSDDVASDAISLDSPDSLVDGEPEPESERAIPPSKASSFMDDLEPIPTSAAAATTAETLGEDGLSEPSKESSPSDSGAVASDEEPASAPMTESAPETVSMDSYVCDDCVYVATCPNKDQRLPKDCGSFQWK